MKKEKEKNPIIKPEDLPEGEKVYLKKSLGTYRVIYPWKNEDGTIHWFNLLTGGSWWKLIWIIIVVMLILGMSYSYARDTKACRELISNPCKFFANLSRYCTQTDSSNRISPFENLEVNLSGGEES